jgi:hypothetical protein
MENGWERIYSTDKPHLVSIVREILDENDIESVEVNKRDSVYGFGDIEIFVKEQDAVPSRVLIQENNL